MAFDNCIQELTVDTLLRASLLEILSLLSLSLKMKLNCKVTNDD